MKTLLLGIVATLMLITTAAYAYPTLAGPTGGLDSPSALTQPNGQLDVALDWVNLDTDNALALRAAYGLAPNWEISAIGVSQNNGDDDLGLGVKYALPKEFYTTKWAVGANWMNDAELFQLYLAGTRPFTDTITGSLGILYSNYAGNPETIGFLNAECTLSTRFTLGGEGFFGAGHDYGNLYLRTPITGFWSGEIGLQSAFNKNIVNLGACYSFGATK